MVDLGVWVMRQDLFYYRHRNIYPGAQMMSRISSSPSAPLSPTSLLWIIRNALKFSSKIAWLVEIKIIEFFWQNLFSFCGRVLKRLSMRDNLLVLIVCIRKEYIHTNLIAQPTHHSYHIGCSFPDFHLNQSKTTFIVFLICTPALCLLSTFISDGGIWKNGLLHLYDNFAHSVAWLTTGKENSKKMESFSHRTRFQTHHYHWNLENRAEIWKKTWNKSKKNINQFVNIFFIFSNLINGSNFRHRWNFSSSRAFRFFHPSHQTKKNSFYQKKKGRDLEFLNMFCFSRKTHKLTLSQREIDDCRFDDDLMAL